MSYPGNASLAPDIQTRILDTFQQTLSLVEGESLKEARLGCDFILRLDPMFEPARWLQDRLDSAEGEIHLDDLRAAVNDAESAAAAPPTAQSATAPTTAHSATQPTPRMPSGAADLIPDPIQRPAAEPAPAAAAPEPGAEPDAEPKPRPEPAESAPGAEAQAAPGQATAETAEPIPAAAAETVPTGPAAAEPSPAGPAPAESSPAEPSPSQPASAPAEPAGGTEDGTPAMTQAKAFGDAEEPVPASSEEVMDSPVAALDTESEKRVHDLLDEGQAALDRGEYQSAIDAWSRIFLIDIDHPEANQRIEQARKLKAEAERSVEEAFHEALGRLDKGDVEQARAGLEKVLEMQPDHLSAREQLERLARPGAAEAAAWKASEAQSPPASDGGAEAPAEADALDTPELAGLELGNGADALSTPDGDAVAPPTAVPIPKPRRKPAAPPAKDRKKLLLYVGAAIVLLAIAGGWLLSSRWSQMFPNGTEPVAAASDRPDAIERAEALHAEGKTASALAQLKRLPPHHELYSEAQALVAQWEALTQASTEEEGPTEADLAQFDALIQQARAAEAERQYLRVEGLLERAAAIQPLDEEATRLKLVAADALEPLRRQLAIFRQGEWEMALRDLWLLRERMPDSPDLDRLMVDSYYNLGVRALQRGDTGSAASHFAEALKLTAGDEKLERAARFASTYRNRPEDLLYRIFVKYLPFR